MVRFPKRVTGKPGFPLFGRPDAVAAKSQDTLGIFKKKFEQFFVKMVINLIKPRLRADNGIS